MVVTVKMFSTSMVGIWNGSDSENVKLHVWNGKNVKYFHDGYCKNVKYFNGGDNENV